jgi:hypothetical protein
MFKYARSFEGAGPFIVIFGSVIGDIIKWGFFNFVIFIPFACAFWMTFGNFSTAPVEGYREVGPLLYNIFSMMVGNEHDFGRLERTKPFMARLLCGSFIAVAAIITLNLLIALLTNTFERLYENAIANAVMQRARGILLLEKSLWRGQETKYYDFIKKNASPEIISKNIGRLLSLDREEATIERVHDDVKGIVSTLAEKFGKKFRKAKKSDLDFVKMDVNKVRRFQEEIVVDVRNMKMALDGMKGTLQQFITNINNNKNNKNNNNSNSNNSNNDDDDDDGKSNTNKNNNYNNKNNNDNNDDDDDDGKSNTNKNNNNNDSDDDVDDGNTNKEGQSNNQNGDDSTSSSDGSKQDDSVSSDEDHSDGNMNSKTIKESNANKKHKRVTDRRKKNSTQGESSKMSSPKKSHEVQNKSSSKTERRNKTEVKPHILKKPHVQPKSQQKKLRLELNDLKHAHIGELRKKFEENIETDNNKKILDHKEIQCDRCDKHVEEMNESDPNEECDNQSDNSEDDAERQKLANSPWPLVGMCQQMNTISDGTSLQTSSMVNDRHSQINYRQNDNLEDDRERRKLAYPPRPLVGMCHQMNTVLDGTSLQKSSMVDNRHSQINYQQNDNPDDGMMDRQKLASPPRPLVGMCAISDPQMQPVNQESQKVLKEFANLNMIFMKMIY